MTKARWVIVDGWGVVYEEPNFVQQLVVPHLRACGCTLPFDTLFAAYREASLGRSTAAEFWAVVGFRHEAEHVERGYVQTGPKLRPDAREVLESLRAEYRLGLLSNDVGHWAARVREHLGIDRVFDEILISSDAGTRKPDPSIYRMFLARAHAAPRDCVFVDDRTENLTPAADLGMKTIHFSGGGAPDAGSSAVAASWTQLKEVIARVLPARG